VISGGLPFEIAKLRIILNKAYLKVFAGFSRGLIPYFCAMKSPVYLDYNSTTPVDPAVLDAMLPWFNQKFGNAASRTHSYGWVADDAVKTAREQVATLIGATAQELVFCSGATEACNLAIKGVWENYRSKGNHIITVATEHKAVLDTCSALKAEGAELTVLGVDKDGFIDLKELEAAMSGKTILVCIMLVNNETGVIQPLQKISQIVKRHGAFVMCDATQAAGKIPIDVNELGCDLLCLSAHKFYGPKGVGALYVRRKAPRVTLFPQLHGGGHERGLRSGTLNVPGIVGLGVAAHLAAEVMTEEAKRIRSLRDLMESQLTEIGGIINGSRESRIHNTINISFPLQADRLISRMPGLAIAIGSACSSADPEPSHVLSAMGLSKTQISGSVRISLGRFTTENDIAIAVPEIKKALDSLS
jgi:cysteine desulfurase